MQEPSSSGGFRASHDTTSNKRNTNLPQQLTLDHVSPATKLLEKRRQMFQVQEALDAQKEEFQLRETAFKRREELLKNKDRELQESLIKFNKFLQDNDSKRNRAEKKEREEIKQRQAKEQELTRLHGELVRQKESRQAMEDELKKMLIYHEYLDSVLDVADEFPEITDLLSRYETLEAAHQDLISRAQQADSQQEAHRDELKEFIRNKTDEILYFNNKIAELQKYSERTVERTQEELANSERQLSAVADLKLRFGQVMMACENIYQRCCDRSSVQRKRLNAETDETAIISMIIDKLLFIQDYMLDLGSITKGFRLPEGGLNKPSTSSGMRAPLAAGAAGTVSPTGERSPTKSVGGGGKRADNSTSASLREM